MVKERLVQARELIQAKRYDEARTILKSINHPKAQEWLAKLDQIAPASTPGKTSKSQLQSRPAAKGQQSGRTVSAQAQSLEPEAKSGGAGRRLLTLMLALVIVVVVGGGLLVATGVLNKSGTGSGSTAGSSSGNTIGSGNAASGSAASLAQYFPSDVMLYASMRTDDEFIGTLDGLISSMAAKSNDLSIAVTGESNPDFENVPTIASLLDQALQQATGKTFSENVRPWLGGRAAVGGKMDSESAEMSFMLVAQISDKAAATQFVQDMFTQLGLELTPTDMNGYNFFDLSTFTRTGELVPGVFVGDSILMITLMPDLNQVANGFDSKLSDSAIFKETVNLLPGSDYYLLMYTDATDIVNQAAAQSLRNATIDTALYAPLFEGAYQQAFGVTILDDNTYVMDVAQNVGDLSALDTITLPSTGPVDRDFLRYVPDTATFVMQGTNIKNVYDAMVSTIRATKDGAIFDEGLQQIEATLTAVSIDLNEDILNWLTGDYAMYLSYDTSNGGMLQMFTSPPETPADIDFGFDVGVLLQATDAEKAKGLVDKLEPLLTAATTSGDITLSRQEIGGANAIVLGFSPDEATPMDIIIGANDTVLVIGTRAGATKALEGTGNFNSSADFAQASKYMLDEATLFAYLDHDAINMIGDLTLAGPFVGNIFASIVGELGGTPSTPTALPGQDEIGSMQANIRQAAESFFTSGTITTAVNAQGDALIRLVITLAD